MTGADTSGPIRPEVHRLLLDVMLGKLTVYLRMCGYDAAYAGDLGIECDDALCRHAVTEDRLLLSRDRELVDRTPAAILVESRNRADQFAELAAAGFRVELADPPRRCGRCNGAVERVDAKARTPRYAPSPAEQTCWQCVSCGQIFWKGSHWDRVQAVIESIRPS